jgi:hypothetical protein
VFHFETCPGDTALLCPGNQKFKPSTWNGEHIYATVTIDRQANLADRQAATTPFALVIPVRTMVARVNGNLATAALKHLHYFDVGLPKTSKTGPLFAQITSGSNFHLIRRQTMVAALTVQLRAQ